MLLQPVASWVDPSSGRRQDTAHVLLHPILDTKLQVLTDHSVLRVLFDSKKRCSGVEITSSKSSGTPITIGARKQVVLCAGTINSPQILERSGIGNRSLLSSLNISVVSDLPGVGTNFQDHHFISSKYKSSAPPSATLDGLWGGNFLPASPEIQESGMLGWNSGVLVGKIRPSATDLARMSPRFQEIYARDFKAVNKPLALVYGNVGAIGPPVPPPGQYISLAVAVAYGYSRGHVHIKGPDVNDGPDFDAGTLSDVDCADIEVLVWAYKRCREMIRRMKFAEGGWPPAHPNFSETSEAAIQRDEALVKESRDRTTKGDLVLEDIAYNEDDDKAIEQFVKDNAGTFWHYAGTCAMKPLQDGGVVDENLSVYGVDSLKVAGENLLRPF
jgi:alcohol oxidase